MPLHLPSRPSLDRLKRIAKELLAAARSGESQALERLHTCFADATPATAKLSQAQTVIARDYGLTNWPALVAEVDRRAAGLRAKMERIATRTVDAATLAERWFTLAEAGDLDRLWHEMGVGKHRSAATRDIMLADRPRYDRFVATIVEKGLTHRHSRARFEFAHVLDSFGNASCIEPLRALLDDPVPRVRWMAMHALTCHDCNAGTCPDDPELLTRLEHHLHHDENPRVRRFAAIALGEAGGIGVKATLEGVVAEASDPKLRRAAEYGLRQLMERM